MKKFLSNKNLIKLLSFIIFVYIYSFICYIKPMIEKTKDISLILIENELKNLSKMNTSTIRLNFDNSNQHLTVISLFFTLNYSKHSDKNYRRWMRNMLLSINAPLAIFTDYKTKNFIIKHRSYRPTILYLYESVWQLMRQLEIRRDKAFFYYIKKYVYEQQDKDPEQKIHNPNLYAIWNIKAFVASRVATDNPFNSKFFIYSDMGAWREGIIPRWPNKTLVKLVTKKLDDKILFGQVNKFEKFSPDFNIIEGGFFAGNKWALKNFEHHFYNLHDKRLSLDLFIGKDQTMMNILAFKTHPKLIARLNCYDYICNKKYNDSWFFYQIYFASNRYYKCNHEKLSLILA